MSKVMSSAATILLAATLLQAGSLNDHSAIHAQETEALDPPNVPKSSKLGTTRFPN